MLEENKHSRYRQEITREVLQDISFRARLYLSPEHEKEYEESFTKILGMLNAISEVAVCKFKGYEDPPLDCHELRSDTIISDINPELLKTACPYLNEDTSVFEVPKVISEGS